MSKGSHERDPSGIDEWLAFGEGPPEFVEPHRDYLTMVAVILGVVVVIGIVLLWPTGETRDEASTLTALGIPSRFHAAEIIEVLPVECSGTTALCDEVAFELTEGPHPGFVYRQTFAPGSLTPTFGVGKTAILSYIEPSGRVMGSSEVPCDIDPTLTCVNLRIDLVTGASSRTVEYQPFPGEAGEALRVGEQVLVDFFRSADGTTEVVNVGPLDLQLQYQFSDLQRRGTLVWVALVFALVVLALGRLRGAFALAGLAASIVVLLVFVLPAILDGRSPVLVAVFGAAAIAYLALYLAHGFSRMTTVALLGTLAALVLTALLSGVVVAAAEFTGLATEENTLLTLFDSVDVRGLLLAGIVLGAAGAIDDVTVTQASAVWELHEANPELGTRGLVRSGLRIGRDHIASTVNTLLLAYAGAALPLLVLFVVSAQSLGTVANSEVVAIEIVRTLVGSIGLVAAVPFTTWLAAYTVGRSTGS